MANVTKRGNSYRIRVFAGYDNENKQIVHSMTWTPSSNLTQKQIEKELSKQVFLFEEKCKNGLYINSSIKFSDFAQRWINDYAQKQLKAKTVTRYKELLKRINQGIGHIKLEKLQPTHLLQFYENLKEKNIREDIKYKCIIDLKYELDKLNLTKTKFSKIAGISTATLNQACKGNNISFSSAQKISRV